MIKAVIFDMDGLMIESEPIQSKAFSYILRKHGKKPRLKGNGLVQTIGINERDNLELMRKQYGIAESAEKLLKERKSYYLKILLNELKPKPGLEKLIDLLKKRGTKMAVASSSLIENIQAVLEKLNLDNAFEVIVSGEAVKRGKPFPDIFLTVSDKLRIDPGSCLVLEDAENGVRAAKRAGMRVIAVLNRFTLDQDFSKADKVVDSLDEINWKLITSV